MAERMWQGVLALPVMAGCLVVGCGGSMSDPARALDPSGPVSNQKPALSTGSPRPNPGDSTFRRPTIRIGVAPPDPADEDVTGQLVSSDDTTWEGADPGPPPAWLPGALTNTFRNTYYDFPRETASGVDETLFDASCRPISRVTKQFYEAVCVQGSGRLLSGGTVSFARRNCPCASACPRTGQQICFDRLSAAQFPWGRGALGQPIMPLRTVAVDPAVIPLGTTLFIPEVLGLRRPDASAHDGCFVAQDRGMSVVGKHVDIFTGDPETTAAWQVQLPSNRGVHVQLSDPRCGVGAR